MNMLNGRRWSLSMGKVRSHPLIWPTSFEKTSPRREAADNGA